MGQFSHFEAIIFFWKEIKNGRNFLKKSTRLHSIVHLFQTGAIKNATVGTTIQAGKCTHMAGVAGLYLL